MPRRFLGIIDMLEAVIATRIGGGGVEVKIGRNILI